LKSSEPGEIEGRLRRSDGVYRWFLFRATPSLDRDGNLLKWFGTNTDIEDLKRAQRTDERLREAMSERTRLSAVRAEIATARTSKDTVKAILHNCCDTLVRHLDAAFARIWTLKNACGDLELQASAGMYTRLDGRYSRISIGDMKIGRIAEQSQAHLTNDVQN